MRHRHGHTVARPHALRGQRTGPAIRPRVQCAVARHLTVRRDQRRLVRILRGRRPEQFCQRPVARIVRSAAGELHKAVAVGLVQQVDLAHRACGFGHGRRKEAQVFLHPAPHRRRVVQGDVEGALQLGPLARLDEVQEQVEMFERASDRIRRHVEARKVDLLGGSVEVDPDRHQRRPIEVAFGFHFLHEGHEVEVLVFQRVQHGTADRPDMLREAGLQRRRKAQRQEVHAMPDQ